METQYNQNQGQKMEVTVEEVNKDSNEIYINDGQGSEGWFPVREPAKIQYCKTGKASITLTNGTITFCKSLDNNSVNHGNTYNKPYQKSYSKPNYGGFRSSTQSNPIRPANGIEEKKESKRIGMMDIIKGVSPEEIKIKYNMLSVGGKWIVASNIFPRADLSGKYDCFYYISEEREGFDPTPYVVVEDKTIEEI